MTQDYLALQLIGETVTISYIADPPVGYGRFRLENSGATTITASVESAWLELGEHRQLLTDITVFDRAQEQMVNPEGFKIDGETVLSFLLGFPRFAYEPRFGDSSAVGLRLKVNGSELQALSRLKFVRRIPHSR